MTLLRTLVALVAIALWAAPASAQTYVAAVLGADLARSYESSSDGVSYPGGDRDALSWALRAGTAFGSRWGVELDFNRGGELESDGSPVFLASQPGRSEWSSLVGLTSATSPSALSLIYPAPTVETEQRTVTWNAIAWVKQPISSRADLVVLAGIGFSHVTQETEFSFTFPPQVLGIIRAPYTTKSSAYGAGPIVGVETRVRMTDHLELTPGLRVQSLGNALTQGIVIRPSVALGWTF